MSEPKEPPFVYVEQHHTQKNGKLTAFRFVLHYDHAQAEINILPSEPRSIRPGIPEIVRLEIHSLIDALEEAAQSSSNILLQSPPRR